MSKSFAVALAAGVCLAAVAVPAHAQAQNDRRTFSIAAGTLQSALDAFARQSGRQLIYKVDEIRGLKSSGARGSLGTDAALDLLLSGTGFSARADRSGAVAIVRSPTAQNLSQTDTAAPEDLQRREGEFDAGEESTPVEDILVTGSRIRRAGFDTLEPAIVISSEYLETRGITNVADALNEVPSFGVGVTPDGIQANLAVGQNFVNRFGLGSARTLTLLNGRRVVSTNPPSLFSTPSGLAVDLNIFPTLLVERIENIAIGGAPTYGSDAIAGTVNVIMKSNFKGLHLSASSGITERGDNANVNISAVGGFITPDDRGNITGSLSYDRVDGVLAITRPNFQGRGFLQAGTNPTCGLGNALIPGRTSANDGRAIPTIPCNSSATDGVPSGLLIHDPRNFDRTEGGLLYPATGAFTNALGLPNGFGAGGNTRLQFDRAGNLIPYDPGFPFGPVAASGGDGYSPAKALPLTSDLERYTAFLIGHYKITDNIRAFAEGTLYRAYATEVSDLPLFNVATAGGLSGPLIFSATDPRLNPQARAQLTSLGVTDFRLSRASTDILVTNSDSRTEVYRGVFGLDGIFNVGGYKFFWEASANFGKSIGYFHQLGLNQQNFVNAINVTKNAQGQIVCDPNPVRNVAPGAIRPAADAACVPLDVFGANRASPAAVAYVTDPTTVKSVLKQRVYNINVSGNLFDLWGAGPIGVAAGYEHRYEYAGFFPDEFLRLGRGRTVPLTSTSGSFNTDEVFGELLIPLVSPANDFPAIYSAEIEAKARYVHNTVNGGFTAYTVGGRLSPVRGIQFRGNYTRSLRAPSVVELFTPLSPAASLFPDPCDAAEISKGANPSIRARNCAAFFQSYGITTPTQFNSLARVSPIAALGGGDPTLRNEEGRSYTFGVVLQPTFLPRFRAAIDWNDIRITGNLAFLSAPNIAEGCYDDPNFDTSNVDDANMFCSLFDRVRGGPNNGQLVNDPLNPGLRNVWANGAFIQFKGLTAELYYSLPLETLGLTGVTLDLGATYFYMHRLLLSNNNITINPNHGELSSPRHSAQFNVGLNVDDFGFDVSANYTGKAVFDRLSNVETNDIRGVSHTWVINGTMSWKLKKDTFFRFTVDNVFDRFPPFPISTQGFGNYDYLGRRFTVGLDYRF